MKRVLFACLSIAIVSVSLHLDAQSAAAQGQTAAPVAAKPTPVKIDDGKAELSPENTKVDFVGTHVGDEPKPRLGGFQKFKGKLTTDEDGSSIKALTMEFETDSLWTQIGNALTSHLKNEDFLDVKKYPTAKFESKRVSKGEEKGTLDIVGDFTLMEKTQEITIPVTMTKSDEGVLVKGEFMIDRVSFGMTKMADRVSKEVAITLSIGEKTKGGAGGGATRGANARGRGGRGGRNPATMFKTQDANGDGKLTGEEIPDFFRGRMDMIDQDGDEAITLEELQKMIESRGGRGRAGGGR